MTVDEMQEEIDRLKKELAEAKAANNKVKRSKFLCPDDVRKKHKNLLRPQSMESELLVGDVVDNTRWFNSDAHLTALSRFVRNAMFVHVEDVVLCKGRINERIERRLVRYAKPFGEMTDEEYENYKNCMDEVLGVIEKYAK